MPASPITWLVELKILPSWLAEPSCCCHKLQNCVGVGLRGERGGGEAQSVKARQNSPCPALPPCLPPTIPSFGNPRLVLNILNASDILEQRIKISNYLTQAVLKMFTTLEINFKCGSIGFLPLLCVALPFAHTLVAAMLILQTFKLPLIRFRKSQFAGHPPVCFIHSVQVASPIIQIHWQGGGSIF